jgi:hypothetical protein
VNPLTRFARYLKAELWRPDDPKIHVRKRRPGLGWTLNLHALRERWRARQRLRARR